MAWPAAVLPCFISRFLYRPLNAKLRAKPLGVRVGGVPGQVADGPTKGRASVRRTPLLAAQPPGLSQFQQLARKTPNLGASTYLKPLALSLR